jgi:acyl-CoA dehydrogenase
MRRMIDFTIPPELADVQRRVRAFVQDVVLPNEVKVDDDTFETVVEELRVKAREAGLWNPHLPAEYDGMGLGALGMALVSQECGVSVLASLALNCLAPDEGNMHLLEHAGTPEQKERYLRPLADARIRSCFAMTERDVASSDPTNLQARAVRDGDRWVINGEKWFITGAGGAAFAIVVAQTDPDAGRNGYTLFLVDSDNPGWRIKREIPTMGPETRAGGHYEIELVDCTVGPEAVLGEVGQGFTLSQVRLGPARLAHAMRWIGVAQRSLDMAAARALERESFGKRLAEHQSIQWMLADSAIELYASRLMVLHAAWLIETGRPYRQEVSIAKVYISEALNKIVDRALQVFGSLGYSTDTPIEAFYRAARAARIYDGASEVHRMVIARTLLKAAMAEGTTKGATGDLA